MKFWPKILFEFIIALAIFFSIVYLFLAFRGKPFLVSKLESATQKKVTIGSLHVSPPFNLVIKNLNIEGTGKIGEIYLSPSVLGFFVGRLAFNSIKVVNPEFTFERMVKPEESQAVAQIGEAKKATLARKKTLPRLIFKHLKIKDGKIKFSDHTVGPEGIRISVENLNLTINNIYSFPGTVITSFDLQGRLPWKEGMSDGKISLEGWINLGKKDMQASLKIEDIDGVYLYPYYSNWVDLEKTRIQKANLNFTSNINGLNNNVVAECHLELTDIVRKPLADGESEEKASRIANQVLDIFRSMNQGKIVLDFTLRTKMDSPQFGFDNIKSAFENKITQARGGSIKVDDILFLPGRFLLGTVKGLTNLSKAVIDSTFAVGNEFKKALQDTLNDESSSTNKKN